MTQLTDLAKTTLNNLGERQRLRKLSLDDFQKVIGQELQEADVAGYVEVLK